MSKALIPNIIEYRSDITFPEKKKSPNHIFEEGAQGKIECQRGSSTLLAKLYIEMKSNLKTSYLVENHCIRSKNTCDQQGSSNLSDTKSKGDSSFHEQIVVVGRESSSSHMHVSIVYTHEVVSVA